MATLTLTMADEGMERLQALIDKTEAAHYGEVFRNALRLYEAMIARAESGVKLYERIDDRYVEWSPFD